MINQQLLDYIRAQRTAGLSKEAITQALAAGGWTPNDVNEAWLALDGVRTPPPPPPPSTTQPIGPRTIIPPLGSQPPGNGLPPQPTVHPIVAQSEFSTAPVRIKRSRRWLLVLSIVLLILLIVGSVAAFIYFNPWVSSTIPGLGGINQTSSQTPESSIPADTTPASILPNNASSTTTTTSSTTPGQ